MSEKTFREFFEGAFEKMVSKTLLDSAKYAPKQAVWVFSAGEWRPGRVLGISREGLAPSYIVECRRLGAVRLAWAIDAQIRPMNAEWEYYRVPRELHHVPDYPCQAATEKVLRPYIRGSKWNFEPAGRGGAVIARAVRFDGVRFEGRSICSLVDNFSWAQGHRLAILDMSEV